MPLLAGSLQNKKMIVTGLTAWELTALFSFAPIEGATGLSNTEAWVFDLTNDDAKLTLNSLLPEFITLKRKCAFCYGCHNWRAG